MKMEDLLARLQNGETAKDIAREMTDMLNQASDAYVQEQKKKDAQKDYAMAVANAINEYCAYMGIDGTALSTDDVIKIFDTFFNFYKGPNDFKIDLPWFKFEHRSTSPKATTKQPKTVNEILNDWITKI